MTKITENNHSDNQTLLNEDVKQKIKKPSMYKVLMLNDDYTPMDFVVFLLKKIFGKSDSEATDIMLNIHKNGSGLCGYYSYEIAETKTLQVIKLAKANEHPLQCTMEKI